MEGPNTIGGLPLFVQTTHTCQNSCGNCGSNSTSGCWRRGWKLSKDAWINLCNRCGLRYKNGKLPPFQEYRDPNEPERPLKVKREPKLGSVMKTKKRKQMDILGHAQSYSESQLDEGFYSYNPRLHANICMQQQGYADTAVYQDDSVEDSLMPLAGAGLPYFHNDPSPYYNDVTCPKFVKYYARRAKASSNYVLFYVIDEQGYATLAVVGADSKYSGHFQYASTPEMRQVAAPLRCSNRQYVLQWLSALGASISAKDSEIDLPPLDLAALDSIAATMLADVPSSAARSYVGWKYCTIDGRDGSKHTEYYLVDKSGAQQLAASAEHTADGLPIMGKTFATSSPAFGCTSFAAHDDVARWLNFAVERSASQRVRRSLVLPEVDDLKPWAHHQESDLADQDSRGGLLHSNSGAVRQEYGDSAVANALHPGVSGLPANILEDDDGQPISEAFHSQPELLDWVIGVPHEEEVAQFSRWTSQLTAFLEEGRWPAEDILSLQEVIAILNELSCHQTSLRLLESTGISKPVALLRNHCVLEIAELADQVARSWRDTAAKALSCATSRLQPLAVQQQTP